MIGITILVIAFCLLASLYFNRQHTTLVASIALVVLAIELLVEALTAINIFSAVCGLFAAYFAFEAWMLNSSLSDRSSN